MKSDDLQLLLEHHSAAGPSVTHVRGSLIVSSLQGLRELGFYERYLEHLPASARDSVLFAIAASWLPLETAMAHYAACEAMKLSNDELGTIGQNVSARIMGTFLGTVVRASRKVANVNAPLIALENYDKLWDRLLQGGGCRVRQLGPKDAVVESFGMPMLEYRYFRIAYAAVIRGAGLMFAKSFYARVERSSATALTVVVSWV
jgi:hypothetical protein